MKRARKVYQLNVNAHIRLKMMTQLTLLTMLFIDRWVDILGYYPPPEVRKYTQLSGAVKINVSKFKNMTKFLKF